MYVRVGAPARLAALNRTGIDPGEYIPLDIVPLSTTDLSMVMIESRLDDAGRLVLDGAKARDTTVGELLAAVRELKDEVRS